MTCRFQSRFDSWVATRYIQYRRNRSLSRSRRPLKPQGRQCDVVPNDRQLPDCRLLSAPVPPDINHSGRWVSKLAPDCMCDFGHKVCPSLASIAAPGGPSTFQGPLGCTVLGSRGTTRRVPQREPVRHRRLPQKTDPSERWNSPGNEPQRLKPSMDGDARHPYTTPIIRM
ncbi:hypothetical protein N657DRAFT_642954 [Parathielavia appendiculata]|uniref:Uncharacterized protein n=1 Tax=Parathielavia appendiculata TaxID=2587402 RepID=A0AAN6Z5V1_9PEZI|nr:hypothetical protein N657DRAFT_642954 [Parathielavia appendiculata]